MTTLALVLGVVLAAGAVLLVALPFLHDPSPVDDRLDAPTPAEERRLALVEQRDQALAALKELEFDHRTGKITDEDYRRDVGPLRQAAAAALRRLDDQRQVDDQDGGADPSGEAATMGREPDHAIPTKEARLSESQPVPEPTPPPDEGTPPTPAPVPEPYPPPDEATIPSVPQE